MEIGFKVQNLAVAEPSEEVLVITHEFTPPSELAIKKRGYLFITLNIKSKRKIDLNETAKIFLETIQENFYRITEDTPLHALEKALERATKIIQTVKTTDTNEIIDGSKEVETHFAAGLIWNRVLYTSYMGQPAIYLIRGSGVRNLATNPATSEIWTNSGILDNEDVLIIGTDAFQKEFPAQEITSKLGNLSHNIAQSQLKSELGAMLIKISMDEKVTLTFKEKLNQISLKDTISNSLGVIKAKFAQDESLSDKFKVYQNKKSAPVSSISGLLNNTAATQSTGPSSTGPRRISGKKTTSKYKRRAVLGLAMLGILGYASYSTIFNNQNENTQDALESISISSNGIMGVSDDSTIEDLHNVFIDTSVTGDSPMPISIDSTESHIYFLDAASRRLYRVDPETKETRRISESLDNAQYLRCTDKVCYIVGGNIIHILDPEKSVEPAKDVMDIENIIDAYPYGTNLYMLTDSNIHTISNKQTDSRVWLRNEAELDDPRSFAIDGNIYVLEGNTVNKYFNGQKQSNFELDNTNLGNPIKLSLHGDNLYILDIADNVKSVFIYNKNTGNLIDEVRLVDRTDLARPISFTVAKSYENKLLFVKDRIIYEVE